VESSEPAETPLRWRLFGKTDWHHSLLLLGGLVTASAFLSLGVKFNPQDEVADSAFAPLMTVNDPAMSPA
jgi:hypothetical protein